MTEYFKALSAAEYQKLKDAVSLITVYIAGADGHIDTKELEWAEKLTRIRAYNLPDGLQEFYQDVGEDFHEKLELMIEEFPQHLTTRNPIIEERLEQLNPILAKLNPELGARMYSSFKSYAKHVAKADGGVLGMFSIGPREAELIELKPLNPIHFEAES